VEQIGGVGFSDTLLKKRLNSSAILLLFFLFINIKLCHFKIAEKKINLAAFIPYFLLTFTAQNL
jgi:hypothetical protein